MLPSKWAVAVAVISIFASVGPTHAQSNRSSGASHGVTLYYDFPYSRSYQNVDGANNGSGVVVGIAELGLSNHSLVGYARRSLRFMFREPAFYQGVSVAANTDEFLAWGFVATVRFGNSVVLQYGSDPLNRTRVARGSDESSFVSVDSDRDGNRVEVFAASRSTRISSITRDGVTRWTYVADFTSDEPTFFTVTFDAFGNTVATGFANRDTVFFGRNIQRGSFFFKVSPSGEVLWLRHVMDSGEFTQGPALRVRTAGDGTIVLVARARAPFDWAGQTLEPTEAAPEFLLAAGPDGSELWARPLDNSSTRFLMRVHQAGQIAIAGGSTGCNGTFVRNFDPAGNLLWERLFDPQACEGRVRAMGLTFSDDDVVVSGEMQGTADLGFGPITFPEQQGFYLGLSM